MSIHPGQNVGRKPKIGPTIKVTVSEDQAARIERLLYEARRRYQRVPREYRSRSAVVRAAVERGLGPLERRVYARPAPKDEG